MNLRPACFLFLSIFILFCFINDRVRLVCTLLSVTFVLRCFP